MLRVVQVAEGKRQLDSIPMMDLSKAADAAKEELDFAGINTAGLFHQATMFKAILPDPTKPDMQETPTKLYIKLAEGQSTEIKIIIPTVECHAM